MAADATATIERKEDGVWAGSSIGDASFAFDGRGLALVVSDRTGENPVRAEDASRDEAWGRAVEQVQELGMLVDRLFTESRRAGSPIDPDRSGPRTGSSGRPHRSEQDKRRFWRPAHADC